MGLETALQYGLLGALGGGAKVIQSQEEDRRKQEAQFAEDAAKTDRENAIEQARYERNRKDTLTDSTTAHGRELGLINARKDPNEAKLTALKLEQAKDEMNVPQAVKMEYEALKKQNETISAALYKAQAEGTYDKETAAKAEQTMSDNTRRMGEMLKKQPGYVSPEEKSGIDLSAFDKGKKQVAVTAAAQPSSVSSKQEDGGKFYTSAQQQTEARRLIAELNRRDSMSIANTRSALDKLDQSQIGGLRKQAGI